MAFSAKGVYERYLDLITPVFIYICLCAFSTIVGLIVTMKYVFEIRHGPLQDSKNASLDSISIHLKRSFIIKIASILIMVSILNFKSPWTPQLISIVER